jgi:hypothetical protein
VEDVRRAVTRIAIKEARLAEIKQEVTSTAARCSWTVVFGQRVLRSDHRSLEDCLLEIK